MTQTEVDIIDCVDRYAEKHPDYFREDVVGHYTAEVHGATITVREHRVDVSYYSKRNRRTHAIMGDTAAYMTLSEHRSRHRKRAAEREYHLKLVLEELKEGLA